MSEDTRIYPSLDAWVDDWYARVMVQHLTNTKTWCPQWWAHSSAIAQLAALWDAWEALYNQGGTSAAEWFTSYGYPITEQLMRADGPLHGCKDHRDPKNTFEWAVPKDPSIRVQQQPPTITTDPDGTVNIDMPDIEGVYYEEFWAGGDHYVRAIAEHGYELTTGHRDQVGQYRRDRLSTAAAPNPVRQSSPQGPPPPTAT